MQIYAIMHELLDNFKKDLHVLGPVPSFDHAFRKLTLDCNYALSASNLPYTTDADRREALHDIACYAIRALQSIE